MFMIGRSPSSNPPGNSEIHLPSGRGGDATVHEETKSTQPLAYVLHQYYDHCVKMNNDQTTMGPHRLTPPASNKYIIYLDDGRAVICTRQWRGAVQGGWRGGLPSKQPTPPDQTRR